MRQKKSPTPGNNPDRLRANEKHNEEIRGEFVIKDGFPFFIQIASRSSKITGECPKPLQARDDAQAR